MTDIADRLSPPVAASKKRRLLGMTALLAWRNLTHDRLRFCVTIIGIVFSVTLMAVQSGLLLGFATTASAVVDRAGADIWIAAHRTQSVDLGSPINADRRYQALASLSPPRAASTAPRLLIASAKRGSISSARR